MLADTREQVLGALRDLVAHADRVVVLAAAVRGGRPRRGAMRPALEAVGVEPRWWGWEPAPGADDLPPAGVPTSVGLLALSGVGWAAPPRSSRTRPSVPVSCARSWANPARGCWS
ncbi:hypothetical protein NKG05_00590 [Oerskovia sp. M15]